MARRSAQNKRYQKDSKVGSTRRSAASAKPKRASGASGGSGGSSGDKKKSRVPIDPPTPEFKRWRKIWLGLLVAAVVFSVGAWYTQGTPSGTAGLVFAYSCLFSALYIDFTKIRRLRKAWHAEMADDSKKKDGKKSAKKMDTTDTAIDAKLDKSVKLTDKIVDKTKSMFGNKKGDA